MVTSAKAQNHNRKYEFAAYAQSHTRQHGCPTLYSKRMFSGWSSQKVELWESRIQQRCRVEKAIAVVSQFCCGIVWPSQSTFQLPSLKLKLELVKHVSMSLPQNGRRKQYWFFGPFSVLSRFLCQVLNQTWDLLGFFMFTSPISSKQSDLTIPLPFQTAKQSAKQPQLSKNEANWMGISIWAWPLTLFRKLNSLASSGIIQRIVGFSAKLLSNLATSCWIPEMHCMLAWRLLDATWSDQLYGFKLDTWRFPKCRNGVQYMAYGPNPAVLPHSCTCPSETMVFAAFWPSRLAGTAPEAANMRHFGT